MIEPGRSWEHTFHSPGEYYHVCFSHKLMYGKIVVKE
jgi:plastocyanin